MACQNAVYQWTTEVTTHLPHLSKPQATVLALWSLGMVLARSCALSAVASWLAAWLGRNREYGTSTVAGVLLRSTGQARQPTPSVGGGELLCAAVGLGTARVGREPTGAGAGCHPVGTTVCGAGDQCGLSGLCDPGGLGGTAGGTQAGLETGMVAVAAALTACPAAREARDCVGRSGLVGPLAVSPDRAPGLASVLADQQ